MNKEKDDLWVFRLADDNNDVVGVFLFVTTDEKAGKFRCDMETKIQEFIKERKIVENNDLKDLKNNIKDYFKENRIKYNLLG